MSTIECPICLENCSKSFGQLSTCNHKFCKSCIKGWLVYASTCPLDRSASEFLKIYNNFDERKLIETIKIVPKSTNDNDFVDNVLYVYDDEIEEESDTEEPDNPYYFDYTCEETDDEIDQDEEIFEDEDDDEETNSSMEDDEESSMSTDCDYMDDCDDL